MSMESGMLSNHLILCHPLLSLPSIFPSINVFPVSRLFASGGQSIGASASPSVLPVNIQGWFPLGLTGLISLSEVKPLSRAWLFATPWTVAHQAPTSMGFSRQEYWSGLPFPSLGNLPDPGIEPASPALAGGFFTTELPGKPRSDTVLWIRLFPRSTH